MKFNIGDVVLILTDTVPYNELPVPRLSVGTVTKTQEGDFQGHIPLEYYVEYPGAAEGSASREPGWWFAGYQLTLVKNFHIKMVEPDFTLDELEWAEEIVSQMD